MKNPLVFIILVNFNGEADTIACVQSLNALTYDNYRIIIVDNGSATPISEEGKAFLHRHAQLICHDKNEGFAGGNNIGIRSAMKQQADMVLLLNNDTTVEPDFLNVLVGQYQKHPETGIFGGLINLYDRKDVIWYGGGYFEPKDGWGRHERNMEQSPSKGTGVVREVSFITGCLMLIPIRTIERIGLLDEELFLYFEDTDYCCRVTKAGMKMLFCEDARIYHKVYGSSAGNNDLRYYYFIRNIPIIIQRHCKRKAGPRLRHLKFTAGLVLRKQVRFRTAVRAIRDFLAGKFGPYSDSKSS